MTDATDPDDKTEPPRETTPGRGQGNGEWLENRLAETLESWGYLTAQREQLLELTADVVAKRDSHRGEPSDYLVCECKDWANKPIGEETIIRLCLLAHIGSAMPVLCHTTYLTDRAWKLAQVYDVRLLTYSDLFKDRLPPLTKLRPPRGTLSHRHERDHLSFRSSLTMMLRRHAVDDYPDHLSGPAFERPSDPPCYVPDRTGRDDYVSAPVCDYDFG